MDDKWAKEDDVDKGDTKIVKIFIMSFITFVFLCYLFGVCIERKLSNVSLLEEYYEIKNK